MDAMIKKLKTGETAILSEIGLIFQDFQLTSVSTTRYRKQIAGRPGFIEKGSDYESRTLLAPAFLIAKDLLDFPLKRDEIFYWLGDKEPFYIIEGRKNPSGGHDFISGKRYLVVSANTFQFDQIADIGKTDFTFETYNLPFGETVETTLSPFTTDYDWTVGHAEIFRDDLQYVFLGNGIFRVYNGGTETVDPNYMYFQLTYKGASTNLSMVNHTNNSMWKYNGTSNDSDEITVELIDSYKNGLSITADTELDLLTLSSGWNEIEVTGAATTGETSFDFRWYFR